MGIESSVRAIAAYASEGAHRLCEVLFEREGRVGQRKLWGIVGLVRRYPRRLIEAAGARAMQEGVYSYSHVKTLTERLMEEALALLDVPTPREASLTQSHALIRAGDDYADLFTLGAKQSATLTSPQTTTTQAQTQVGARRHSASRTSIFRPGASCCITVVNLPKPPNVQVKCTKFLRRGNQ